MKLTTDNYFFKILTLLILFSATCFGATVQEFTFMPGQTLAPQGKAILYEALDKDYKLSLKSAQGGGVRVLVAKDLPNGEKEALISETAPLLVNILAVHTEDKELAQKVENRALFYLGEGIRLSAVENMLRISRANQLGVPPTIFDRHPDFYKWVVRYNIHRLSDQYEHEWKYTRFGQPYLVMKDNQIAWDPQDGFNVQMQVDQEGRASNKFVYTKEAMKVFDLPASSVPLSPEEKILARLSTSPPVVIEEVEQEVTEEVEQEVTEEVEQEVTEEVEQEVTEEVEQEVTEEVEQEVIEEVEQEQLSLDDEILTLCWAAQETGVEVDGCIAGPMERPDDYIEESYLPEQRLGEWQGSVSNYFSLSSTSCHELRQQGETPHALLDGRCTYVTNDGETLSSPEEWEAYRGRLADLGVDEADNLPALPEEVTQAQIVNVPDEKEVDPNLMLEEVFGTWEGTWGVHGYTCSDWRADYAPDKLFSEGKCGYRTVLGTAIKDLDEFNEFIAQVKQPLRLINNVFEQATIESKENNSSFAFLNDLMKHPFVSSMAIGALVEQIYNHDKLLVGQLRLLDDVLAAVDIIEQTHEVDAHFALSGNELDRSRILANEYREQVLEREQALQAIKDFFAEQGDSGQLGVDLLDNWIGETKLLAQKIKEYEDVALSNPSSLQPLIEKMQIIRIRQQGQAWWTLTLQLYTTAEQRRQALEGFSQAIDNNNNAAAYVEAVELDSINQELGVILEERDELQHDAIDVDQLLLSSSSVEEEAYKQSVSTWWQTVSPNENIWKQILTRIANTDVTIKTEEGSTAEGDEELVQAVEASLYPFHELYVSETLEEPLTPNLSIGDFFSIAARNNAFTEAAYIASESILEASTNFTLQSTDSRDREQVDATLLILENTTKEGEQWFEVKQDEDTLSSKMAEQALFARLQQRFDAAMKASVAGSVSSDGAFVISDQQYQQFLAAYQKQITLWRTVFEEYVTGTALVPTGKLSPYQERVMDMLVEIEEYFNTLSNASTNAKTAANKGDTLVELYKMSQPVWKVSPELLNFLLILDQNALKKELSLDPRFVEPVLNYKDEAELKLPLFMPDSTLQQTVPPMTIKMKMEEARTLLIHHINDYAPFPLLNGSNNWMQWEDEMLLYNNQTILFSD